MASSEADNVINDFTVYDEKTTVYDICVYYSKFVLEWK